MTRGPLERKVMKEEIETQTSERLFVLSANDKVSTEKAMQNLGVYLEQRPEVFQNNLLSNLAYTLGQRRSVHPWRIAITSSSSVDLVEALSNGKVLPCKQELEALRIGWIFTGQGAQWWAMGRELYQQYPVYAAALDQADEHLCSIGASFSLVAELDKDETTTRVNEASISQPSCTAVQLALVDLLQSWGIRPSAVAGHSSGEIAAAYAAGLITFKDAMTIAYHRGRLIPILKEKYPNLEGAMMAVGAGKEEIVPLLDRIPTSLGEARIACINSPSSVTISGDAEAVTELQNLIEDAHPGMFVRKLQVDTAYHSHHMSLVAKDYTKSLLDLEPPKASGEVRFHSSLLGRLIAGNELDITYWVQNLVCAVRFDEAVQSMCQLPFENSKTGVNFLVELGPHAALQGPIKQILKHIGGPASKMGYASVLSRKRDSVQTSLAMAGTLFVKGALLEMGALNFPKPLERPPQVLVDMPRYSWNHSSKFYHESRFTKIHKHHNTARNDIIGILAPYSNDFEKTWRNVVRLDDLPWLRHHQMQGVTLFPISAFLAMALEAAAQTSLATCTNSTSIEVKDLVVKTPVALIEEEELEMTITLRSNHQSTTDNLSHEFAIRSWSSNKGWTEHCVGEITVVHGSLNDVDGERVKHARQNKLMAKSSSIAQTAVQPVIAENIYEQLSEIGVVYGATFQGLQSCYASPSGSMALLAPPDTAAEMPHHAETNYILHPALLEQVVSMYWPIFNAMGPLRTVHLPTSIGKFTVSLGACNTINAPGSNLQAICEASGHLSDYRPNNLSLFAWNAAGEAVITMEDLLLSPILERQLKTEESGASELCYKLTWEVLPSIPEVETKTTAKPVFDAEVIIVHGESEFQSRMALALASQLTEVAGIHPVSGTLASLAATSEDKLCIFLAELDEPFLAKLDGPQFYALQHMLTKVRGLLWVVHGAYAHAKDPTANMVTGLSRTLRSEGTLMKFITLELDGQKEIDLSDMIPAVVTVFSMTLCAESKVEETEFLERDGNLLTPRIVDDHDLNDYVDKQVNPPPMASSNFSDSSRPLRGSIVVPGVLDSLAFEDDHSLQCPLPDDHVEFQVRAIGINARDAEDHSVVGLECSGVVTAIGTNVPNVRVGDRIAAITAQGSLSTIARTHFRSVMKIPDHTPFEAAATMPVAYCTANYAIIEQARLSDNDSMLIHDAASAVGQAALTIAFMIGAQIWTTVRTKDEKDIIMRDFGIAEDRIWFAATDSFAEHVLDATNGRGVDVILNTLPESSLLGATSRCLANFGRLITVGAGCNGIDHAYLKKNASVHFIDVDALVKHRPQLLQRTLASTAQMLQYGKIQPIHQIEKFSISDAVSALHSVQAAGARGKAVIVPQSGDLVQVSWPLHVAGNSTNRVKGSPYQRPHQSSANRCNVCPYRRYWWSWT
jgi:acyl transferase domain-containing protein/NADPH:quinone reductase-like Zn-dependent oxidoreductase